MSIRNYIAALAFAGMFSAAQAGEWTCVGSAFALDESSLASASNGITPPTAARLQFLGNTFGTIEARCNITNPNDAGGNPGWGHIEITHNDPDGMANAVGVVVQLVEVNKVNGIAVPFFTYDSSNFNSAILRALAFNKAWNFVNFAYYVNVTITRPNANMNPWLARVRLFD
jgi:hypothetical protein